VMASLERCSVCSRCLLPIDSAELAWREPVRLGRRRTYHRGCLEHLLRLGPATPPLPVRDVVGVVRVRPACSKCIATTLRLSRADVERAVEVLRRVFVLDAVQSCQYCARGPAITLTRPNERDRSAVS
jgi:hypothetical protein